MLSSETNLRYFKLPNPGLWSYFDRVRAGNPDEYRTTFFSSESVQEVLSSWAPTVESLTSSWPSLLQFENDMRDKVGPLSIQKPLKDRMDDIDSYYDSILKESVPISADALASVVKEWMPARGIRLRSQTNTMRHMKLSTNSGNPYFTKRRSVVDKTIPCTVVHTAQGRTIQYLVHDTYLSTAILGWRGQEGGPTDEDVKQRVVWMFPFAINIQELQFYQPAIELAQKFNLVPAWVSMEAVDDRITRLFDTKGANDLIVCSDFSKFDQHFNRDMQAGAAFIISKLMTPGVDSNLWLNNIFPIKYDIPLALGIDDVRTGKHGMASGSGGTNFDETLAHRALQYECAQSVNQELNPNSMCLGDDGILSFPGITEKVVMSSYSAHGQDMNLEKQYGSTQDCVYLRRWHHTNYRIDGVCVGVYSTYRALGRLLEQERYYDPEVWSKEMVALRQLSIIENCKYHPLKEQFVDFCMKGDKYRLGLDIPGFLDDIDAISSKAIDLMPDFLGYTKSLQKDADHGINSWWIVNYLKSKR